MVLNSWADMRQFDQQGNSQSSGVNESQAAQNEETVEDILEIHADEIISLSDEEEEVVQAEFEDDDDWYAVQEKKLAKQYGGNFIRVKYTDTGNVAYFCELCVAECNAKKSLEAHCIGMKHLKKKDLWEKEGKPDFQSRNQGNSKPPPPVNSGSFRELNDRRGPPYDRSRDFRGPDRSQFDRIPSLFDRFPNDPYRPPPRPLSAHRDRYSPERGMNTFGFGDYNKESSRRYEDENRRRTRSPPPRPRYGGRDDLSRDRDRSPHRKPVPPSPPRFKSLSEERTLEFQEKVSLSLSPTSKLLEKLAECCVKSDDDADLALNVVFFLIKSLKEYCQKKGEKKIGELLMEAEIKLGTVKTLKVGMKMLSNIAESAYKSSDQSNNFEKTFQDIQNQFDSSYGSRNMNSDW